MKINFKSIFNHIKLTLKKYQRDPFKPDDMSWDEYNEFLENLMDNQGFD
jgi:hypothetical protein